MAKRSKIYRPPNLPPPADRQRTYERERGSARARGYNSLWERAASVFKDENPLCLGCQAAGLIAPAEVVDHVVPHRGDTVLFWDRTNWQPACRWHHDVVKQRLEAMYAKGAASRADLRLDSPAALHLTRLGRP